MILIMNDDDFKKIVQDSLKALENDLGEVKGTLDKHGQILEKHGQILAEHTDILENRVLPSVSYIETNIKIYNDMYQKSKSDAKKLEKRIEPLESQAGMTPPPELAIADAE